MLCTSQKDVISLELETLPLVFPTLAACHLAETHAEKKGTNPPFNYTAHFIISPQILLLISFTDFVYISGVFQL